MSIKTINKETGDIGDLIAGGTMACYTGSDNVQGTFICTEVKD